jgi:hypothetical protein
MLNRRIGRGLLRLDGVTPPFVKNCTLRPEFTRGLGAIRVDWSDAGQVLSLIKALPRRPRYRSSGRVSENLCVGPNLR